MVGRRLLPRLQMMGVFDVLLFSILDDNLFLDLVVIQIMLPYIISLHGVDLVL